MNLSSRSLKMREKMSPCYSEKCNDFKCVQKPTHSRLSLTVCGSLEVQRNMRKFPKFGEIFNHEKPLFNRIFSETCRAMDDRSEMKCYTCKHDDRIDQAASHHARFSS